MWAWCWQATLSRRAPFADLDWNQPITVTLATILLLAGVAFRQYAIRTLGRFFTNDLAVSADQQVIQEGPYRLIRHPAYSGTLLSALGAGLGMTNWLSLLTVIGCFAIGLNYRIRIEESAMSALIGQPYVDYMQRTKRLIPHIL